MLMDTNYHKFYCWVSLSLLGGIAGYLGSAWAFVVLFAVSAVSHAIMDMGMRLSKGANNG